MLADDSPNLSMYLNLYDLGHDEYVEYCEKLTLGIIILFILLIYEKSLGFPNFYQLYF